MVGFKTVLTAAAVTLAAQSAAAAPLTYEGNAAKGSASVWGVGANSGTNYSGVGASFKMKDATDALGLGTDFIAFCVDLIGFVGDDDYVINNEAPFDPGRKLSDFQKTNVENLFHASYADVDVSNNVQAAAFQLALWEAAYETNELVDLSLDDGVRRGDSNSNDIKAQADTYLSQLASWGGVERFHINFLDAEKDDTQDLVMATPIPVPAAGLLLLGGLGALGFAKRRKDKRAA